MVSFEIRWNTKKFLIDLNDEEYDAMTVGDLKLKCQQLTEIEPQYMKLLARGAIIKNDTESIKNYKILSGSKIMLMGSKTHISPLKASPPKDDAPISTRLHWIRNLRESALKPDIHRYEKQAQEHLSKPHEPKQTKELINYGSYLHEQLMHMISQLDTMPEANEEERVERRKNVKETESLLDLIESVKNKLLQLMK
ncbi:hypothetical protein INT47_009382 [Mucor saturninus]|uniref:Ubiquitin-like domain-containing protein n=1 Tax=Mucor saturninus TaxID=64648 RepID=A0A8H7R5M0_9FUNG|nr:hypothetical protein INT47_009382 [Mucor saturninus]